MAATHPVPPSSETLGELLAAQAAAWGDAPHLRLLDDDERETTLSYAALATAARRVAGALRARGVGPGDRVALMLDTGAPLVTAFYALQLLGAIAVPLYPPFRLAGLGPYLERLGEQLKRLSPRHLIAEAALHGPLRLALGPLCPPLLAPEALAGGLSFDGCSREPDAPALIQFSSGSTGPQKGVVLTHAHLLANGRALAERLALVPGMRGCSWLPLYHDMGLIGALLIPLIVGFEAVLFPPRSFLLDPARWLRIVDRYRARISLGPNFAYQLLLRRVDDAACDGLDLSCWAIALNGAEPIDPALAERFEQRFGRHGLPKGALLGVYGLAEAALGVCAPAPGGGTRRLRWDAAAWRDHGRVVPAALGEEAVIEFASVGTPLPGYRVEIRDPLSHQPLPDGREGQIAVHGPSLTSGYWRGEGLAPALEDGWLATGDLGAMCDGELVVSGRLKELIIRGGRNYQPQDLERAAERVAGVRGGCSVAFGVPDAQTGTERLVIAFETREPACAHAALAHAIRRAVGEAVGLAPDVVLALPPGSVPKTTSGKRQRGECRRRYQEGRLGAASAPWDVLAVAARHHLGGLGAPSQPSEATP